MADLQNLLAALAAQQSQGGTPSHNGPPPVLGSQYPPPQYATPPAGGVPSYGLPQPINSGSVDIGGRGIPGDVGMPYDPRTISRQDYRRTRSPTPPRSRDQFRDNYNPYRDERRAGTERGHNRDRSFSPRPNRYGSPGYRERSPGRDRGGSGDPTADGESEIVPIEKGLVGLIIGRGGENLRRVEQQTGARVQFMDSADTPGSQRHCKVSGSRAARASAKAEIFKIIEDNELAKRGQDKPRMQGKPALSITQEGDSLQIMVPDRTVGLIIGRGGETIRDLQERSGCHVNIVGENKSVNGFRPVNLIGSAESQRHAKDLILEIVESDQKGISIKDLHSRKEDPYGKINDSILVPGEAVGMVIGKGGETIREMQNSTGCKINVSPASGRDIEREIGLIGTRSAVEAAKRAILDKVDAAGSRGRPQGNESRDSYSDRYSAPQSAGYLPAGAAPSQPPPAQQQPGGADPYAAYGGYNNYVQMWYAAMAQQQGGQGQGEPR